jgi:hypothetical protein
MSSMTNQLLVGITALILFSGCKKQAIDPHAATIASTIKTLDGYRNFFIKQGDHYCAGNSFKSIELNAMKFTVKFDSTAIYTTSNPENQYDINKLWGFADNDQQHHEYSARIGWRWSNNALRLFAYVYNNSKMAEKEITTVAIGRPVQCRISISPGSYLFQVNEVQVQMPRAATTLVAKGYQLYPYFGGDEAAPHTINIWIKDE